MISLPPQLTPSELLWCEELPPFIVQLLHISRSLRRECKLSEASRCARDAMKADQQPGTKVIQALALIHLADARREMGRLGPALDDCQNAFRIFQSESARTQRHNEAVAAYALGLVCHLLGSDMDALKWYQVADALFKDVKDDWVAVRNLNQVKVCTRTMRWMETLGRYLTSSRARTDANIDTRMWVPLVMADGDSPEFALAELEVEKYVVGREININGEILRVSALKGKRRISLDTGSDYYALEIPDEARAFLDADEGGYVLVVREECAKKEGPAVLETLSGPEFGEFERDDEGTINFVRVDAKVIGGDDIGDDLQIGYIAALLERQI